MSAGGSLLAGVAVDVEAADRIQLVHRPAVGTRRGTVEIVDRVRWGHHRGRADLPVHRVVQRRVAVRLLAFVAFVVGIVASSTGSTAVGNKGCTCTACTVVVAASSQVADSSTVVPPQNRWNSVAGSGGWSCS